MGGGDGNPHSSSLPFPFQPLVVEFGQWWGIQGFQKGGGRGQGGVLHIVWRGGKVKKCRIGQTQRMLEEVILQAQELKEKRPATTAKKPAVKKKQWPFERPPK